MNELASVGRHVHFVGIGGSGMQGVADVLLAEGCRVSGSDMDPADATRRLVGRGARVCQGHAAQNVPADADCVVYSAAVKPDNPEMEAARVRGIPRLKYSEMLGMLKIRSTTTDPVRTEASAGPM